MTCDKQPYRIDVDRWAKCDPKAMAKMSEAAIMYALQDAKSDILRMHAELETLRAKIKAYEDLGDAAARLEIESLRAAHGGAPTPEDQVFELLRGVDSLDALAVWRAAEAAHDIKGGQHGTKQQD